MSENIVFYIKIILISVLVLIMIFASTWSRLGLHPLIIHLSLLWRDPHNLTRVVNLGYSVRFEVVEL